MPTFPRTGWSYTPARAHMTLACKCQSTALPEPSLRLVTKAVYSSTEVHKWNACILHTVVHQKLFSVNEDCIWNGVPMRLYFLVSSGLCQFYHILPDLLTVTVHLTTHSSPRVSPLSIVQLSFAAFSFGNTSSSSMATNFSKAHQPTTRQVPSWTVLLHQCSLPGTDVLLPEIFNSDCHNQP